jgi:hypothetical protein
MYDPYPRNPAGFRKHIQKMPQNRITAECQVSENPSPFEEFLKTPAFRI